MEYLYENVVGRDNNEVPYVDLYIAGFPCQPFSDAGHHMGIADAKSEGVLIAYAIEYILLRKPRLVVMENVRGLLYAGHVALVAWALNHLAANGYVVHVNLINTSDHGIPHSRTRLYIVAILESKQRCTFRWPKRVPYAKDLKELLNDPRNIGARGQSAQLRF